MKTFHFALTAVLLLGLATTAFAQDDVEARRLHDHMLYEKNRVKAELTAVWNEENPYLMAYQTLYNDDLREGIGVSKEQYQKMLDETKKLKSQLSEKNRHAWTFYDQVEMPK